MTVKNSIATWSRYKGSREHYEVTTNVPFHYPKEINKQHILNVTTNHLLLWKLHNKEGFNVIDLERKKMITKTEKSLVSYMLSCGFDVVTEKERSKKESSPYHIALTLVKERRKG
jgi:hypothetical protein